MYSVQNPGRNNISNVPGERLSYLDYIKTLAIVLVIVYHCDIHPDVVTSAVLSMCVTMFFCVNGFLMLNKHRDAKYLLKKSARLLFLILFWGCIASYTGMIQNGEEFNFRVMLRHLFLLDVGYGNYLWFLITLVILNFFNPFVYYFLKHASRLEKIVAIAFIAVCTLNFFKLFTWQFSPFKGWQSYALLYYIGGGILLIDNQLSRLTVKTIIVILLTAICAQSFLNLAVLNSTRISAWFAGPDIIFNQYGSIFVVISTLSTILLFRKFNLKSNRVISFIGKNTLGIYLLQDVVIKFLNAIGMNHYVMIAVCVAICVIIVYILDTNKFTRYFVKI